MKLFHGSNLEVVNPDPFIVIETIDNFIEQLQNGDASKNLIRLTIEQLAKQQPNDQYCFTNNKLQQVLSFFESYEVSLSG
ncbi:hypothetical protein FACS1894104_1660 [Actinomycetota bacterium]|nr:hypothetical protein FACS1894104_1660 [Actinomycetota bacterium]